MLCGINPAFAGLSPTYGQVTYALLTRAPVSSPKGFSLDLHVLGLSLAFILSQDQTLRCNFLILIMVMLFPEPEPLMASSNIDLFELTRFCTTILPKWLLRFHSFKDRNPKIL